MGQPWGRGQHTSGLPAVLSVGQPRAPAGALGLWAGGDPAGGPACPGNAGDSQAEASPAASSGPNPSPWMARPSVIRPQGGHMGGADFLFQNFTATGNSDTELRCSCLEFLLMRQVPPSCTHSPGKAGTLLPRAASPAWHWLVCAVRVGLVFRDVELPHQGSRGEGARGLESQQWQNFTSVSG